MQKIGLIGALLFSVVSAQVGAVSPAVDDGATQSSAQGDHIQLKAAVDNEFRRDDYRKRDIYRNPYETLRFFEVKPSDTVVEIWPGGGWYAEILAPYLKDAGVYYAAHFSPAMKAEFFHRSRERFENKVSSLPKVYANAQVTAFFPPADEVTAPAGSADKVLTFRNVHNWMKHGYAEAAFQDFFKVLKPGGMLGVVEHRARPGTSLEAMNQSGYVTEAKVIELAEAAGFAWVASSPINNNVKDSKDHPRGVWTLPPSLRLGDERKSHYLMIGESDRMTLKFIKPKR